MGGGHHSTTTTTVNQHEDIHNVMDSHVDLNNSHGKNNIDVGNVGAGSTIYQMQNLALGDIKPQLQNLGANAVYIPESNSLVLLV